MLVTEDLPGADTEDVDTKFERSWQRRIEALANGECTEDEFVRAVFSLEAARAESAWDIVAIMDQRYRRGRLAGKVLRSVESKIARRQLGAADDHQTGDVFPVARLLAPMTIPFAPWPSAPAAVDIGTVLKRRYEITGLLGEGGMGSVFTAIDRTVRTLSSEEALVAIKVLHEQTADRPMASARLRREFECAHALSHPNIVKVFDLDSDGTVDFFTMELLRGEHLVRILQRYGALGMARETAWVLIREIGEALAHAHERKVVHADLKPQNIMVCSDGRVKLLDFGASSGAPDGSRSMAVTPAYASCELLNGAPAEPSDDLFALGCLAYELLAGNHPYQYKRATDAKIAAMEPARPTDLSDERWEALRKALAFDREQRSPGVREWLDVLKPGQNTLRTIPRPNDSGLTPLKRDSVAGRVAVPARVVGTKLDQAGHAVANVAHSAASSAGRLSREVVSKTKEEGTQVAANVRQSFAVGSASLRQASTKLASRASTLRMPRPSMPKINLPKLSVPKVPLPKVTLPKMTFPKLALPKLAQEKLRPALAEVSKSLSPPKLIAVVGVLLVMLTSWAVITRPGSGSAPPGTDAPTAATAWLSSGDEPKAPSEPPDTNTGSTNLAPAPTASASPTVALNEPEATPVAPPSPAQAPEQAAVAANNEPPPAPPVRAKAPPAVPSIGFVNSRLAVGGSSHFVEVRVRRTGDLSQPASFSWWTEDGSALAGFEYIGQQRLKAGFAAGSSTATLFVKVASNQPRRQASKFDVVIGDAGALNLVKPRVTVTLLPGR